MKKLARSFLVVGCAAVASSLVSAQGEQKTHSPGGDGDKIVTAGSQGGSREERYRIGYQDTLEVQVFRHPELAQKVSVNTNGTINLFRLKEPIVAVCRTERELADDIADAYRKDYLKNPEVNVVAVEQKSQAFAVIRAVEKPGSYFINRRVRLLELLAFAGGPSKDAGTRLLVARTGSTSNCSNAVAKGPDYEPDDIEVMDFKITDVLEGKVNLVMQPGDIVSVMDADIVFMYGNVNEQGQVKLTQPITLTQAIASAKGLKPSTKKDRVRILRQKPGSLERDELVFSLTDIEQQKVQDPFLEPNDIVAVSEDKAKSILNGIKNSLTQGVSTVFYRFP
jgi:polysaccharide biosynthesis/export protein